METENKVTEQEELEDTEQVKRIVKVWDADYEPVVCMPLEVKVNDDFHRALKNFKFMVQKDRVLSNYKKRMSYEKPSDYNRRKKAEGIKKVKDTELRNKKIASGEFERELAKKKQKKEKDKLLKERKAQETQSVLTDK